MTTIAAVQGKGWAVIGYDSRVTDDERVYTLPKNSGKVVSNGSYMLGAAGDMRAINLLSHVLKAPTPPVDADEEELDAFISQKFVPSLKKCFDEAQYGEKGEHESHVIAVVQGVVYDIGSNYDWCRDVEGIYAVGTGGQFALGAIYSMLVGKKRTITAAKQAVQAAVEIACQLDSNSAGPVNVLVQKCE